MARKWPVDGDHSCRLPDGVKPVGYDEQTQTRFYSVEGDDRLYKGVPGAVYSPITPINPPRMPSSTPRQPASPGASDGLVPAPLGLQPSQRQRSFSSRPSTGDSTLVPSVTSRPSHHPDSSLNRSNTLPVNGPGGRRKPPQPPLRTRRPSTPSREPSFGSGSSVETISWDDIESGERNKARRPSLARTFTKKVGGLKRALTTKSSSRASQPESSSPSHITFSPAVNRAQTFGSSPVRPSTGYGTPPSLVPIPTTFDDILANEYVRQNSSRVDEEEDRRKTKYKRIFRRTTWSH